MSSSFHLKDLSKQFYPKSESSLYNVKNDSKTVFVSVILGGLCIYELFHLVYDEKNIIQKSQG